MEKTEKKRFQFFTHDQLFDKVSVFLIDKIQAIMSAKGGCNLALSGGNTPKKLYKSLRQHQVDRKIDLSRVRFFFGDERMVDLNHDDSNYGSANRHFFAPLQLDLEQTFPMFARAASFEKAAELYAEKIPETMDIILLGMGQDGHTASLFMENMAENLKDERRVIEVFAKAGSPPGWRLSLNYAYISRAGCVIFLVTGADKKPVINNHFLAADKKIGYPAERILSQDNTLAFLGSELEG